MINSFLQPSAMECESPRGAYHARPHPHHLPTYSHNISSSRRYPPSHLDSGGGGGGGGGGVGAGGHLMHQVVAGPPSFSSSTSAFIGATSASAFSGAAGPFAAHPAYLGTVAGSAVSFVSPPTSLDCTQSGSLNLPLYQTSYVNVASLASHPPASSGPTYFSNSIYPFSSSHSSSGAGGGGGGSSSAFSTLNGPAGSLSAPSGGGLGGAPSMSYSSDASKSATTSRQNNADRSDSPMVVVQQSPVASH